MWNHDIAHFLSMAYLKNDLSLLPDNCFWTISMMIWTCSESNTGGSIKQVCWESKKHIELLVCRQDACWAHRNLLESQTSPACVRQLVFHMNILLSYQDSTRFSRFCFPSLRFSGGSKMFKVCFSLDYLCTLAPKTLRFSSCGSKVGCRVSQ